MKKFLILCALAGTAFGQGSRYDNNVFTSSNNVPPGSNAPLMSVPYAKVSVCAVPATGTPCTNYAAIYSDIAMTQPITQPFTADIQGRYGFFSAAGTYSYTACKGANCATGVVTVAGAAGGTPGGAVTQGQLNNAGSFGGAPVYYNSLQSLFQVPAALDAVNATNAFPFGLRANLYNCNLTTNTQLQERDCNVTLDWYSAPGENLGNGFGASQGWAVGNTHQYRTTSFMRGITVLGGAMSVVAGKVGDVYEGHYIFNHAGQVEPSGEGQVALAMRGGQGGLVYGGVLTAGTTGGTSITLNPTQGTDQTRGGGPCNGCYVIKTTAALATGKITAITTPPNSSSNILGTLTTDQTFTASVDGTTVADINVTPNGVATGVSTSFSITNVTGTFTSGFAYLACPNFPDTTILTVGAPSGGTQTATGVLKYSHAAGCHVLQGGVQGALDLTAERKTVVDLMRTTYEIVGSTTNTLYYRSYVGGGQGTIWAGGHDCLRAIATNAPEWMGGRGGAAPTIPFSQRVGPMEAVPRLLNSGEIGIPGGEDYTGGGYGSRQPITPPTPPNLMRLPLAASPGEVQQMIGIRNDYPRLATPFARERVPATVFAEPGQIRNPGFTVGVNGEVVPQRLGLSSPISKIAKKR